MINETREQQVLAILHEIGDWVQPAAVAERFPTSGMPRLLASMAAKGLILSRVLPTGGPRAYREYRAR